MLKQLNDNDHRSSGSAATVPPHLNTPYSLRAQATNRGRANHARTTRTPRTYPLHIPYYNTRVGDDQPAPPPPRSLRFSFFATSERLAQQCDLRVRNRQVRGALR